ncbi:hypothetical protein V2K91_10295 [Pseudomonas alliivorans]|nr:hypothetical protein [Pseudomonas alliivorans]
MSRLYRQAGIKQGSSHSGRGSLAAKVLAAKGDVEIVQTILGHSCIDHSNPYLAVDQTTIRRALEVALWPRSSLTAGLGVSAILSDRRPDSHAQNVRRSRGV